MGLEKAGLEVRKNALHLAAVRSSMGFQVVLVVKNPPANEGDIEMLVQSLGQEDPLEEGMATHSSNLAWRIPWTEEPGGRATVHGVTKSQTELK